MNKTCINERYIQYPTRVFIMMENSKNNSWEKIGLVIPAPGGKGACQAVLFQGQLHVRRTLSCIVEEYWRQIILSSYHELFQTKNVFMKIGF